MPSATAIAILLPMAAIGAMSALLVAWVDRRRRRPPVPRRPRHEPDPERAVALARAMIREMSLGGLDVPNVVAVTVAAAVASASVPALGAVGVPSLASGVIALAAFALVATELFYRVWPRRVARATAAHAFLGSAEVARFRGSTGGTVPANADQARAWLEEHPETDANRWVRPQLLAWVGNFDEAYGAVSRMSAAVPIERFERLATATFVDHVAGREVDLDGLEAAAATVGDADSEDWLRAQTEVAVSRSRERLAAGSTDWLEPLIEAQERLGDRSLRIIRRDTWSGRLRSMVVIAASFFVVASVISLLTS